MELLGSLGSALLGNMFAKDRQDTAQQFSASQFANRYQTTVTDMQAAGLNPMLAYSQGGGSPPGGTMSNSQVPDFGAVMNQAKLTSAQAANIEADTENKAAQGKLYEAQAAAQMASAGQSTAMVGQIDATVKKIEEETKNIPLEGPRIKALTNMLADQANLMGEQGYTQKLVRDQLETIIKKLKSETTLLNLDIKAANDLDNIGRTSKQLEPIVQMLKLFIRR